MRKGQRIILASVGVLAVLLLAVLLWTWWPRPAGPARTSPATDDRKAIAAFEAVATVLSSPRCANCHITGEAPLQGDDGHAHVMNVKRGPDGRGTPAMRCANCHQETSSLAAHAPPGAPDWRLPPPDRPMAWKGLSPAELGRMLKDRAKNGNRSLADLVEHVTSDKLVTACWKPGPGRALPPLSHQEFVEKFTEWVNNGAACAE